LKIPVDFAWFPYKKKKKVREEMKEHVKIGRKL